MEKALEILKDIVENSNEDKYDDMTEEELKEYVYEAISELEEAQETIKNLQHNYDVQVEYNNTAYKNYTNMVNSLEQRIEEAMKPKTCDGCVREAEDMQDPHCAFCSRACKDNYEAKEQL